MNGMSFTVFKFITLYACLIEFYNIIYRNTTTKVRSIKFYVTRHYKQKHYRTPGSLIYRHYLVLFTMFTQRTQESCLCVFTGVVNW